ncbi:MULTISPECIES: copper-binding protein [unclassified Leisingera]|uniref:copper-binding protein n=1 Tax=unclassified Leisingera TaxID=2614906 RepID=UPI000492603C|nr:MULTISPECIES: copper-binding protein [unclassified Leisingera]KIC17750.1 cation transporter [Leisingera sp. ANG-DT]KIC23944.1 cation transporter [Leisingera sp. ANG-S3]KIC53981.1 cation transporter [Leisingera sp. ANG-S]KID09612.1 cation transporter [Leisingera sp. ANG1]
MKKLAVTLVASLLAAPIASAQTSHSTMDHSNMEMSDAQMEGAVHTKAIINSIDENSANVSHEPIPEIGWPAMTMDLNLAPNVQMMGGISEGASVTLMLVKSDNGMYEIGAMMPE